MVHYNPFWHKEVHFGQSRSPSRALATPGWCVFFRVAAFLLTIGSFLLTVELFYLQLTLFAFLLTVGAFLLKI